MSKNRVSSGLPVIAASVTFSLLTAAACSTVPMSVARAKSDAASRVQVSEAYGKLPLYFEANQGQTDEQVKFLARGRRQTLFLTSTEAVLVFTWREQTAEGRSRVARAKPVEAGQVTQTVLRMTLVGANREPRVEGTEELPGKANYFIGKDPTKWRTNVPAYKKVQYHNIYPGIDLVYHGNQRQLEYDFVVHPGADPNRILLSFQGVDKLEVDALGDLVVDTGTLTIRQRKPVIYQDVNGVRQEVAGGYVLKGAQRVGFQAAAYDQSRPLVIDPTLFYSTYLGGSDNDVGVAIAVDTALNAYVAGSTASTDFPTTAGAFQTTHAGGRDVFVAKLNPTGSSLLYSTYLGGSGSDEINVFGPGIALDGTGAAYVTGSTSSTDFPTTLGAFQPAFGGGAFDAFVTKLNPTGSGLVYSTYLGGTGLDGGSGIAVGFLGNAYVTGGTNSADFPTTAGAFQATPGPGFVTNLDPTGSTLVYSTYLVGASGAGIAVDGTGNAYITGTTGSTDFPTTPGAFQPTIAGSGDAFVTKLDPTAATLVYSTYLGGSGSDDSFGIAVDGTGNAYITGTTGSTDFPTTPGAFQPTIAGTGDAFVTKLDPTGSTLVYSTYLGGSGGDEGRGIAVDGTGNAYVAGRTDSEDFPTTTGTGPPGSGDAFVTKLNPTGSGLVYSTYLGGHLQDAGVGIAVDVFEDAYVTGITGSFPTTPGAFQTTFGGGNVDAFVAKITEAEAPPGPFSARVTGGGTIDVMDGIGTFSFIIQRQADTGELSGRLQYVNHASGAQVKSVTYTSLVIVGTTATFGGDCTVNGMPCTFTVNVADNGEPGSNDTFTISVSGGPTEGGTLRGGNILITQ
jgi:hypothetical protein